MIQDILGARRSLLKSMLAMGVGSALTACSKNSSIGRLTSFGVPDHLGQGPLEMRPWARYPEKTDLLMLADRPPLLETPLHYFMQDLTPNDAYFVRWHYAGLPTHVDLRTFRLNVIGAVANPLQLSFDDLLTKFEPVSAVVFSQCAGNSRSFFRPQVGRSGMDKRCDGQCLLQRSAAARCLGHGACLSQSRGSQLPWTRRATAAEFGALRETTDT